MSLDYYKTGIELPRIQYYQGLVRKLNIQEQHIHTIHNDRIQCENTLQDPNSSDRDKRMASYVLSSLTSSASNDIFEEQLSKLLGIQNITTKHGWDGNDETTNEPYEYKPTKIKHTNYVTSSVNINDESEDKINNRGGHGCKVGFNNDEANFVIAIINYHTSEFICIYKFKEHILYRNRLDKLHTYKSRKVYSTNIKKCIEFSKRYTTPYEYWYNPKYAL